MQTLFCDNDMAMIFTVQNDYMVCSYCFSKCSLAKIRLKDGYALVTLVCMLFQLSAPRYNIANLERPMREISIQCEDTNNAIAK